MIRRATLGLRAVSDVAEAVKWYDERTPGLGNEFVSAVDEVVETLRRLPESGHIVYGDIRRFPLRQFPYAIYYRVVKSSIRVRACLHDRRRAHVRETAIVWRATSNVVGSRHEEAEWHATCSPNAPNKRIGAATMTSAKRETSRGQQTGSKRPAEMIGAAKAAPKKGEVPPKGTRRSAAQKKTRPEK